LRLCLWELSCGELASILHIFDTGRADTAGEHRAWLPAAGFVERARAPLPGGISLITARKPAETTHVSGGVHMPGHLEGKVALVTGSASGIGRATALTFAREGAKLVVADMNEEGGQQTVHMITEQGGEAIFVRTDVSQAVEVQALISKAVETYGRLDCAHNNAGILEDALSQPSMPKRGGSR
jgi:hypothetical protein